MQMKRFDVNERSLENLLFGGVAWRHTIAWKWIRLIPLFWINNPAFHTSQFLELYHTSGLDKYTNIVNAPLGNFDNSFITTPFFTKEISTNCIGSLQMWPIGKNDVSFMEVFLGSRSVSEQRKRQVAHH